MSTTTSTIRQPNQRSKRAGNLAKIACVGCRRLKMKCIIENGARSCQRCAKGGKPCVLPLMQQIRPHEMIGIERSPITPTTHMSNGSPDRPLFSPLRTESSTHIQGMTTACEPISRISATPPLPTPTSRTSRWSSSIFQSNESPVCHSLNAFGISFGGPDTSNHDSSMSGIRTASPQQPSNRHINVSQDELRFLVRSFVNNLSSYVLISDQSDVGDDLASLLTNRRSLALAMAYVAARFVPGGQSLRSGLESQLLPIVALHQDDPSMSDESRWTILQSLAILYTWVPSETKQDAGLTREMILGSIEALTRTLALHRSGQEVVELSRRIPVEQLRQTFAFKKYTFRLWMFTCAHVQSITSRNPPSMRADSSITRAPQILQQFVGDPTIQRLLARVEMCLLWTRAKLADRDDLGDWWCAMPNELSKDVACTTLRELDEALIAWRWRWCPPEQPNLDLASKLEVDLLQQFTHLCNSIYISQAFRSSLAFHDAANSFSFDVTVNERAKACCRSLLELSPLSRSTLVYSPQDSFSMIAFACRQLLESATTSNGFDAAQVDQAQLVHDVAQILIGLGSDDTQCPRIIGRSLLSTWKSSSQRVTRTQLPQSHHRSRSENIPMSSQDQTTFPHQRRGSVDASVLSGVQHSDYGGSGSQTQSSHSPESAVMMSLDQFPPGTWMTPDGTLMPFDMPHVDSTMDTMLRATGQGWAMNA